MVSSLTELANQALRRLGANRITAITSTESNAVIMNEAWPNTRDEVLRDFPWAIATKRAQLAELSTTNYTEFDYAYQVPNDCVRILTLVGVSGSDYEEIPKTKFRKEGEAIFCDQTPLYLKYVYQLTDVTQYDATLVKAMALMLAVNTCLLITQNEGLRDKILNEYIAWLTKAEQNDAQESSEPGRLTSLWGYDSAVADEAVSTNTFVPRIPS